MASLNRVILVGRIVRDPELKKTTSGVSVTSFTIAVDNIVRSGAEKTTSFIPCTCWNKTAEPVAKYCSKGSLVGIDGRLTQRSYEDKNSNKRSVVEVIADSVQFLERKSDDSQTNNFDSTPDNSSSIQEGIDSTDDDLPF